MSAQPVDIQIFGRSLRIGCPPEEQDALRIAAEDLDQRLQNLKGCSNVTNTEHLVFVVALNVCNELAKEKLRTRDYVAKLQQNIEQALLEQERVSKHHGTQFK